MRCTTGAVALVSVFSFGVASCSSAGSETADTSATSSTAVELDAGKESTSTTGSPPSTTAKPDPTTTTTTAIPTTTALAPGECPAAVPNATEIPVGVIAQFDLEAKQSPEGVVVDRSGNVFVSFAENGLLVRLAPGSGEYEIFGSVPDFVSDGYGFLGLAVDKDDNVYGAVHSASSPGVWRFNCVTGEASLVPGTGEITFPNSLAFDDAGTLYISDSFSGMSGTEPLGAVWRMEPDGAAQKWMENTTLGGTGAYGLLTPLGANGIAVRNNMVYVANTERNSVLGISILDDGAPGEISTIAEGADLFAPDGITTDEEGSIYVAVITQHAVKRIALDGSIETIAEGFDDGLDAPSSVVFASGAGLPNTLYAVNLVFGGESLTGVGPALVGIAVDPIAP